MSTTDFFHVEQILYGCSQDGSFGSMILLFNCRIQDLELAVDRMKQQQENTQKRLKEEKERKAKFEVSPEIPCISSPGNVN